MARRSPAAGLADVTHTYEARGPHLPDVMTRQSPWIWPFVGAALIQAWLAGQQLVGRGLLPTLDDVYQVAFRIDDVMISLLGAALFARHPDARRSLPLLAFGLALLAVGPLLVLVDTPIMQFLDSVDPSAGEFTGTSPASIAYHVFTSLIAVAAVLCLGAGLAAARRRPHDRAERSITALFMSLGVIVVVLSLVPLGVGVTSLPASPYEWMLVGIELALSLMGTLAWSYVISISLGGWRAGEKPRLGWGLASAGSMIGLGVRFISTISIVIGNLSEPVSTSFFPIVSAAVTLGWVLLLAAFALGLPATADPPAATPPDSGGG